MTPIRRWQKELDWAEAREKADAEVLAIKLQLSIQKACLHEAERIIDSKSTDSDSEVWTYWCPDCQRLRDEEVVGSKARAEAEGFQWPADADDYLEPLLP